MTDKKKRFQIEVTVAPIVPGSGTWLAEGIVRDCGTIKDVFDGRGGDALAAIADMMADAITLIRQGKINAQCIRP